MMSARMKAKVREEKEGTNSRSEEAERETVEEERRRER